MISVTGPLPIPGAIVLLDVRRILIGNCVFILMETLQDLTSFKLKWFQYDRSRVFFQSSSNLWPSSSDLLNLSI
jgi:hypothetical protein